ncbi:MAG: class III extradiol ring-cleavage dioxygenase [Thermaerobacter sp.]|nr:class III extradiol ring-cleavage dioxygenase [Thermaerobacter sp.]
MMPSLFVAHGAPLLALEDNAYTRYFRQLGQSGLSRPKAIVVLSAHWITRRPTVGHIDRYDTLYDFGGFPEALYQIRYPAWGAPAIAQTVSELLAHHGISSDRDSCRGLDHGAWVVLRLMYPAADIPVVSLSVSPRLAPDEQYRIGQALGALRTQDILLIASGGTVHNLLRLDWNATATEPWAMEFDQWLKDRLLNWDLDALYRYDTLAPHSQLAVPPFGNDHFVPIFYALGAADNARQATLLHQSYRYGNLSQSIWQFG